MVLLVEAYPHLPDPIYESVFVWYATRCPDEVLRQALHVTPDRIPKRLMAITIDLAITHSYNLMLEGRLGLHAAPEGGRELLKKYEQLGMLRLDPSKPLPSGIRSLLGNDGNYFFHSESSALAASQRLDKYR